MEISCWAATASSAAFAVMVSDGRLSRRLIDELSGANLSRNFRHEKHGMLKNTEDQDVLMSGD